MAGRPKKVTNLEEEIAKQEEIVSKTKQKYDEAVAKLKELHMRKEEQRKQELIMEVEKSSKSYDEIIKFLREED